MLEGLLKKIFGDPNEKELKEIGVIVDKINALEKDMVGLSSANLAAKTADFKVRLSKGETLDDILPEAFAVVREAAKRVLGMRHFDVQLIGGCVLHRGKIAEMRTGEGKTLVATLPAYLNALTGKGVHVVTVNEYLARRDSEDMGRVFKFLGLSVGLIAHALDYPDRKAAYAADITYGTNNEFGFDYLRDNMVVDEDQMVQRPLNYCIVDEVDSILIDEARTPLIISGPGEKSTDLYKVLAQVVAKMDEGEDYTVDEKLKTVAPTEIGIAKAEKMLGIENMYDTEHGVDFSHQLMCALKAKAIMHRDKDYVVKDGEVIIKKYSPLGELGTFAQQYVDSISQILGCPVCVADRDQIIAVAGMPKKDLVGKAIHKDLEEVINDRENIIARHGDTRYVNITSDDTAYAGQVIQTIICEGDAIGAVIVLSKDDKMRFGETEQKTAIIAANFLGKQMEN